MKRSLEIVLIVIVSALSLIAAENPGASEISPVQKLRITVLSTMLAGNLQKGIGEWGFAALVEVDGRRILFDTGHRPSTVLQNTAELGIDLSDITDVVLSHHHIDHVGGLLTLRRAFQGRNPNALSQIHIAQGAFWSRGQGPYEGDDNPLIAIRKNFEATGGVFHEHDRPFQIAPGVWFTGPIPRKNPHEQPVPPNWIVQPPGEKKRPDDTPDDAALVFDTKHGLVVLTGCGHAGFLNTLSYAREIVRPAPIYAATGGFHLLKPSDAELAATADQLGAWGLRYFHGGHCTGLETVYRLRTLLNLPREASSVAAVGSWFDLDTGIHPLVLAR